ncbi:hypothetical protein KCP78_14795 [Salmonella enterica subsp. enterica]|nr:hypothetical protein KCP78_14795 [Salmonella enterica subsp. enterica]
MNVLSGLHDPLFPVTSLKFITKSLRSGGKTRAIGCYFAGGKTIKTLTVLANLFNA